MRALFLNQFYAPDIAATAQVLSALCQDLAARGHDIAVLSGSARYRQPHHGFAPSRDEAVPAQPSVEPELRSGVRVHRITLPAAPAAASAAASESAVGRASSLAGKLARRMLHEARFSLAAYRRLRELVGQERPDVLVAMSTPPTLLLLALGVGLPRRIPVVYWVQDVYPELLWATGLLRREQPLHRLLIDGLKWASRRLYQYPTAAIVLDEAMRDRLAAAGFPPERLHVIDHAANSRALHAVPAEENRIRRLLGLQPQDFVVCYAGNLGRGHDFATLAAALPRLATDPSLRPVHLVFIGEGEGRALLQAAVPESLRSRVHFLPPQESALHGEVLCVGDVALVTLGADFAGLMTPSKIYPLLAASRPILYVGPAAGRVAELCTAGPDRQPVGERVANGDSEGLVAALRRLHEDPPRRQALAQQARRLAEDRFDQTLASARHESLLGRLIAAAQPSPGAKPSTAAGEA